MKTKVVNLNKDTYDVYIGRGDIFGNPFVREKGAPRGSTLDKYREYFYDRLLTDPEFADRVLDLKGKTLGCFCKPHPCHGDIICEFLNKV